MTKLTDIETFIMRRLTEGKTMYQVSFEVDHSPTWVTRRMRAIRSKLRATTNFQAVSIFSRGTET